MPPHHAYTDEYERVLREHLRYRPPSALAEFRISSFIKGLYYMSPLGKWQYPIHNSIMWDLWERGVTIRRDNVDATKA